MDDQRYPTATRDDLIRILDASHAETNEAQQAIIAAINAALTTSPEAAVSVLARYILDNGHVHEVMDVTTGQLSTLATHPSDRSADLVAAAIDTWEKAWLDHTDNHIGWTTKDGREKVAASARDAIEAGHDQEYILHAAHSAGVLFRTDLVHFLPKSPGVAK